MGGRLLPFPSCRVSVQIRNLARSNILKYPNNSWLSFVEYNIIDLIVSMHERAHICRLRLWVSKKFHHSFEMGYLTNRLSSVFIFRLSLGFLNGIESLELAIVKAIRSAEIGHVNAGRVDGVEFGQCFNSIFPSVFPISPPYFRRFFW